MSLKVALGEPRRAPEMSKSLSPPARHGSSPDRGSAGGRRLNGVAPCQVGGRKEHVHQATYFSRRRAQPARLSARSKTSSHSHVLKTVLQEWGQLLRGCTKSATPSACRARNVRHHRGPRQWTGALAGDSGWRKFARRLSNICHGNPNSFWGPNLASIGEHTANSGQHWRSL